MIYVFVINIVRYLVDIWIRSILYTQPTDHLDYGQHP